MSGEIQSAFIKHANQAAVTDGGLTLAYMNEEWKWLRWKPSAIGQGAIEPTRVDASKTKEEGIVQREKFWV